jgi:hypothetical protein
LEIWWSLTNEHKPIENLTNKQSKCNTIDIASRPSSVLVFDTNQISLLAWHKKDNLYIWTCCVLLYFCINGDGLLILGFDLFRNWGSYRFNISCRSLRVYVSVLKSLALEVSRTSESCGVEGKIIINSSFGAFVMMTLGSKLTCSQR